MTKFAESDILICHFLPRNSNKEALRYMFAHADGRYSSELFTGKTKGIRVLYSY